MKALSAKLGYTAAGATVFAAVLVPFFLYGMFTKGFSSLGLHVDEVYSGGPTVCTVHAADYTIDIHRQVSPHMLQSESPFVQLDWRPASGLPLHASNAADIDGDSKPDAPLSFDVPKDVKAVLHVVVELLNPRYEAMRNVGKPRFSELIVRVDDAVLVRVPIARKR